MNYRHAYHAGNFADAFKHAILVALIEALKHKHAGFCYLDTHAGAGRYLLTGPEAQKTREYTDGIGRLLGATRLPAALHVYLNLVRALNARHAQGLVEYPGSPLIAALLTRPQDRLVLCELQEAELAALRQEFAGDARVAVHARDGYGALKAMLPPKERRGLILIDPPFEAQEGEFDAVQSALTEGLARFPTGLYAVWYPIKLRQHLAPFHRWLKGSGARKVLVAELCLHPADSALRLNGCGIALINAPWKFDKTLQDILPPLASQLSQGRYGTERIEWLVED